MHICVLPVPQGHAEQVKPVTEGEMKGARGGKHLIMSLRGMKFF